MCESWNFNHSNNSEIIGNFLSSLKCHHLESVRDAPDPEFCYPAGSGSMPDPDMWDPNRILIIWIRPDPDPNPTRAEKLPFLQHNWKKLE